MNLLLLQTEPPDTPDIPANLEEVKKTLVETLGGVWTDFLAHTPYLIAGLITLIGTWFVSMIAGAVADRVLRNKHSMRRSLRELILRFLSIGIWVAGLLLTAMIVFPGLTPTKALGALGLVSVAVGLAFKDIFENFFAGILLLWRFPFESGDFIECEGLVGRVEDVQIRMTKIRKASGELVVVPNSFLFKNAVEVLTSQESRRIHLITGVAYKENVPEAVEVIEKAVTGCSTVKGNKPVEVYPEAFGASSIDIDVAWWGDPEPGDVRASRAEVVIAIKSALDDAGIEIPFPYRTLTFDEPLPIRKMAEEASS